MRLPAQLTLSNIVVFAVASYIEPCFLVYPEYWPAETIVQFVVCVNFVYKTTPFPRSRCHVSCYIATIVYIKHGVFAGLVPCANVFRQNAGIPQGKASTTECLAVFVLMCPKPSI